MSTTNTIDNSEEIILGSGDLYIVEFTGEIPEDTAIEKEENRAGNIKAAQLWNIPSKARPSRTIRAA